MVAQRGELLLFLLERVHLMQRLQIKAQCMFRRRTTRQERNVAYAQGGLDGVILRRLEGLVQELFHGTTHIEELDL
jgi:hypothetical protein